MRDAPHHASLRDAGSGVEPDGPQLMKLGRSPDLPAASPPGIEPGHRASETRAWNPPGRGETAGRITAPRPT